jgi:predicted transcriptional regulator
MLRRSKLETHIGILRVLARKGPLKMTHIKYKADLNCTVLKDYLSFLLKQGLIQEQIISKGVTVFSVTQRGVTVLKYFNELEQILAVAKEPLNQLANPLAGIPFSVKT